MQMTSSDFQVGGVQSERPFQIRRLGHFGLNLDDIEGGLNFYGDLLGFLVADTIDFGPRLPEAVAASIGPTAGYFLRHSPEHHTFVIFPRQAMDALQVEASNPPGSIINQITWQAGSLQEIGDAVDFFNANDVRVRRVGRDTPGSNWHTYVEDPSGYLNELYYGIEIVGWDGLSKPQSMYDLGFRRRPDLPQPGEMSEVASARAAGKDLSAGWSASEPGSQTYDVDGVLLSRPFKVLKIGPVRLFVDDMEAAVRFYTGVMGLTFTEKVVHRGHEVYLLRCHTDHHVLGLYPADLRELLGFAKDAALLSFGLQLANYSQLRRAVEFLEDRNVEVAELPIDISPGMSEHVYVKDPDGNLIQLYWGMEQIGWEGKPQPMERRRSIERRKQWPAVLPPAAGVWSGEQFLGPWG